MVELCLGIRLQNSAMDDVDVLTAAVDANAR